MYPAPSSKSRGSNLKNQWKIYPSSMGAIMGMSEYDSRDEALAKLWQYGAKDFFQMSLKEDNPQLLLMLLHEISHEDRWIFSLIYRLKILVFANI